MSIWLWRGVLLVLMAGGLALRLNRLGAESIDLEEQACVGALNAPNLWQFLIEQRTLYPYGSPFVPVLFYLWSALAGTSIEAMRYFVLLFGVALIPAAWWAGVTLFRGERGRWAGLVAALCVALSPSYIYQAHEARMYSIFTLFAVVSFVALFRAERGRDPFWWRVNTAANALVIFSHLFGVFLVAAQGLWLLTRLWPDWRRLFRWGSMQGLVALPVILWAASIPNAGPNLYAYYAPPGFWTLFVDFFADDIVHLSSTALWASPLERFPWPAWHGWMNAQGAWLDPILVAAGLAGLLWWVVRTINRRGDRDGKGVLLLVWFLAPVTILVALSYLWMPVYSSRYAIYGAIALYLMMGAGVAALPGQPLRIACVSLLAALYTYQLTLCLAGPMRTEWREALAQVNAESEVTAPLLIEDPFWLPIAAMNWDPGTRVVEGAFTREALCDAAVRCASLNPGARGGAWILLLDFNTQGTETIMACLRERGAGATLTQYFGERRPYLIHVTSSGEAADSLDCTRVVETATLAAHLENDFLRDYRNVLRFEPDTRAGVYLRLALAMLERGQQDLACSMLSRAAEVEAAQSDEPRNLERLLAGVSDVQP